MWTEGNITRAAKLGSSMQFSCKNGDESGPQQDLRTFYKLISTNYMLFFATLFTVLAINFLCIYMKPEILLLIIEVMFLA
jgi:hypothetical protein